MKIVVAKTQKEITDNFNVRNTVFVSEQKIDHEIEFDGLDIDCILFTAYLEDKPVGAARLYKNKVGRVATLKMYRKKGVGTSLMRFIEKYAINHNIKELVLHAQIQVKDFYLNLGYHSIGNVFQEADIDHVKMYKKLANKE